MAGKVLVVGYNANTVQHRAELLSEHGYEVQHTTDVDQAIEWAQAPDLAAAVFIENGMDGESRARLRALRADRPSLPVVEAFFDAEGMLAAVEETIGKAGARA